MFASVAGSERIRKNGHAENGDQRAKCLECGRTFVLQPKGERYDQKFKDQVVAAYQDRMSIRGIPECNRERITVFQNQHPEGAPFTP